MIRSCIVPNDEFNSVNKNQIISSCTSFYKLFQLLFGEKNCTYSVHVLSSHLLQIRGDTPLTARSAFKYESFFSEVRSMYHPGTVSSLKQILQNGLMKRTLQHHSCIPHIHYSSETKGKECNNLIYTCLLYTSPSPRDS